MPRPSATSDGYALAYTEAQRALEDQERAVVELRSRAGALIAAAAIATSFFGGQMPDSHAFGVAAWIAVASFVFVGLIVVAVLWPRRDWGFSMSASRLIGTYVEPPDDDPLPLHLIHRDLALHMDVSAASNREQLRRLMALFRLGAALLVVEVVAWVAALISQA